MARGHRDLWSIFFAILIFAAGVAAGWAARHADNDAIMGRLSEDPVHQCEELRREDWHYHEIEQDRLWELFTNCMALRGEHCARPSDEWWERNGWRVQPATHRRQAPEKAR